MTPLHSRLKPPIRFNQGDQVPYLHQGERGSATSAPQPLRVGVVLLPASRVGLPAARSDSRSHLRGGRRVGGIAGFARIEIADRVRESSDQSGPHGGKREDDGPILRGSPRLRSRARSRWGAGRIRNCLSSVVGARHLTRGATVRLSRGPRIEQTALGASSRSLRTRLFHHERRETA